MKEHQHGHASDGQRAAIPTKIHCEQDLHDPVTAPMLYFVKERSTSCTPLCRQRLLRKERLLFRDLTWPVVLLGEQQEYRMRHTTSNGLSSGGGLSRLYGPNSTRLLRVREKEKETKIEMTPTHTKNEREK